MFSSFHRTLARIRAVFHSNDLDRDLVLELESHIQILVEQHTHKGASQEEAQRLARIELGGIAQLREAHREVRGLPLLDTVLQDIRFALRMFRKSPGFTTVAVLTLALGIGANTAIFSLTNQILLRDLPVPQAERLVILRSPGPNHGHTWGDVDQGAQSFSYPMYKDLQERSTVFSGLLACRAATVNVSGHGETQAAHADLVSGNFFETLEVQPALGRLFIPSDETAPGANTVAVLSYAYW